MLLSDWLGFFDKIILALSGGHFEYFLPFTQNIHTCLWTSSETIKALALEDHLRVSSWGSPTD